MFLKEFAQIFQDKESRIDYTSTVNKFITNLIKISLTLKSYKMEERKDRLKYYINKANNVLESNRKKISNILSEYNETVYYQGIALPFSNWEDCKFHSNLMIKILNHDFICFNTKKRVPYKIVVETVDVEDFKNYSPKPQNEEPQLLSSKTSKTSIDWEIVDEFYDSSYNGNSKGAEIAKTKLNKYQGLQDFAKKIAEDEAKKLQNSKNEKKNWLLPAIALNFLNINKKEVSNEDKSLLLESSPKALEKTQNDSSKFIRKEKKNSTTAPGLLRKMNTKEINLEIQQHFDKISSNSKNTKTFNLKFPTKVIKRTNSAEMKKILDIDESPSIKNRRKLSFKNLESKDRLEFLQRLKSKNEIITSKMDELLQKELKNISKKPESLIPEQEKNAEAQEKKMGKLGPWDELWEDKAETIQKNSAYGHFPSYKLRCLIVKGGDDLRQEILAMQLIIKFKQIFDKANIKLHLRPYEIIVTSANSGILEFIPNTMAIDGLKKKYPNTPLLQFYKMTWGIGFEEAQKNFIESLAAYSLVCYFLQIKDRHNGNMLIDAKGYILHIDFGFMLAFSPGGINFESAPFKFTNEYLELIGGKDSNMFSYYKCLVCEGFKELKKHVDELSYLLEIMMEGSDLPCFTQFKLDVFRERFKENLSDDECDAHVEKLIDASIDNWWTIQYDSFQKMTNGINP